MENKLQQFKEIYLQFTRLFKNVSLVEVYMSEEDMYNFYKEIEKEIEESGWKSVEEYIPKQDITFVQFSDFTPKFKIVHNGK